MDAVAKLAADQARMQLERRRRLLHLGGAAWLGSLMGSTALAQAQGEQLVRLGFAGGLGNKSLSNLALSARDGALLAVEQANQRSVMIGGKTAQFTLLPVDDQSDVNFARLAAQSLIGSGVSAVIGHNTTATSVSTSTLYADASVPLITPTSTGREFTARGLPNVFQLLGHTGTTTGYLAEIATQMIGARRIALLENGTSLSTELAEGFIAKLKQRGHEIIARDAVTARTSDFSATLLRLKSANPDLLFFTGVGPQIEPFLLNFMRLELPSQLLVTGGAMNTEFPRLGLYPQGTYLLIHGLPPDKQPGYAEFEKAYRARFDTSISAYTLFSYDAVGMIIEAMRRINSTQPKALINELHRISYKGISGSVAFGTDGSQIAPPYTLYRANNGLWRPGKTWGG